MIVHAPHSDRAVQEYRARSGAKNTFWINELVKYVKAQGLWDSFRLYPFQPRTNADSGSTAYGLGGLTANEMTLVNGPTWGTSGLAFASASSQYGMIGDCLGSETLTAWARVSHASETPSSAESILGQFDAPDTQRSWLLNYQGNVSGDPYRLVRSSDGDSTGQEVYDDDGADSGTSDRSLVAQWEDSGGRSLWVDKTSKTLSLIGGTSQTSRFNSNEDILFCATQNSSPVNFANLTAHALAFITGTLTTTQRETITDLINEL